MSGGGGQPVPPARDPKMLARFFKLTQSLDKKSVGEFLGERDEFNQVIPAPET